jgi:hypothetical protein
MPLNPCELEISLFCEGLRVPDEVPLHGARGISRTRAGLGSGLELILPTNSWLKPAIWVNAPVVESFVRQSPFVLRHGRGGYTVVHEPSGDRYPVRLAPEPSWYARHTARGVPMQRIGVLQGTYLGIYINPVCAFWSYRPGLQCHFCTTGVNVGAAESETKNLEDVLETVRAARDESGITFVHLNGGYQGTKGIETALPFIRAIKREVGLLVGVQLTPERDRAGYDALIDAGVDHLSFCVEFMDPEWFERICPGKARMLGQEIFFETMAYCAKRLPRGAVSGEIIAGVEPVEATLRAIDHITALGAFPTVCVFRPTAGSQMEGWPPPAYDDMLRVMKHVYLACRRHWIPIGAAPNIEVSIVVNPDDTPFLAERTPAFYAYEAFRRGVRFAARPLFARKMRPRGNGAPAAQAT